MKKLLLSTAAIGLVFAATPAYADIDLNVGGYFKGYTVFSDHDEGPGAADTDSNDDFDFIRDTEIHLGGETVLDNGLTVGAHFEFEVDGGDSASTVDESYVYFSGGWGRVNFGDEDGAAYLLQVAAPSADSNIDGIRQFVQPFNYAVLLADGLTSPVGPGGATLATGTNVAAVIGGFDYDQDITGKSTKLTYLTPVLNGFQAGLTYTPDSDGFADDLEGVGFDDVSDAFGQSYEFAARWEAMFNNIGFILGGGYTYQELEMPATRAAGTETDDRMVFNLGADMDFGPFGIGVAYMEDDFGEVARTALAADGEVSEEETLVIGIDYTTGPFKLGASYFDQENTGGFDMLDTTRYTGGVTYSYAPGVSFRGSVSFIEHDGPETSNIGGGTDDDVEATAFVIGTQIDF